MDVNPYPTSFLSATDPESEKVGNKYRSGGLFKSL
jgi:hypothetical protein